MLLCDGATAASRTLSMRQRSARQQAVFHCLCNLMLPHVENRRHLPSWGAPRGLHCAPASLFDSTGVCRLGNTMCCSSAESHASNVRVIWTLPATYSFSCVR